MSLSVKQIKVDGLTEPGRVIVSFANTDLSFDVETARKVARALLDQADVSELEAMQVAI